MPDITPFVADGLQIIQAYRQDGFRISGQDFTNAVIVMPEQSYDWPVELSKTDTAENLTAQGVQHVFDIADQLQGGIELVLLGTGTTTVFPPFEIRALFKQHGIALEVMDTGAACRTYNVLLAEGRRVAAVLLPV